MAAVIIPTMKPLVKALMRKINNVSFPLSLFANGEQGAWYDPSDLTTLYQDSAGTTPVTTDGDPVGLMLDKSGNGNDATQSSSGLKPIYRTDGTLHWLEFDGVDDFMAAPGNIITNQSPFTVVSGGGGQSDTGSGWINVEGNIGGADALAATFEPAIRTGGGFAAWAPSISGVDSVYRMQHPGSGTIGDTRVFINNAERTISGSGSLAATLDLGTNTTTRLYKGTGAVAISGKLFCAVAIDREVTTDEGNNLDAYSATKSGVTL